jgi:site-specific DNA-methyltransferase (adenine-specific)
MMLIRLVEMRRILKDTGAIFLHCDPSASHYLKILMDKVFGPENYRNEIVWKRTSAHSDARRGLASVHDAILFYSASKSFKANPVYQNYDESYVLKRYCHQDADGRPYMDSPLTAKGLSGGGYRYEYKGVSDIWRVSLESMKQLDQDGLLYFTSTAGIRRKKYLDDMKGLPLSDVWTDIPPVNSQAAERLGYPTQKPLALLERVINMASNPGDIIMDPFCGCGTAVEAAEKLSRQWIGIDITHLAIALAEKRMKDAFRDIGMEILGTPKDFDAAKNLAERDKYQFQWWACSLVNARPYGDKLKGADKGIDGVIFFIDDPSRIPKKIIVSVKGGQSVTVSMIRDLVGVIEREKASMGYFVTLAEPTKPMLTEAAGAGTYISDGKSCPKVQILTIEKLLNGIQPIKPKDLSVGTQTFKKNPAQAQKQSVNKGNKIFD